MSDMRGLDPTAEAASIEARSELPESDCSDLRKDAVEALNRHWKSNAPNTESEIPVSFSFPFIEGYLEAANQNEGRSGTR